MQKLNLSFDLYCNDIGVFTDCCLAYHLTEQAEAPTITWSWNFTIEEAEDFIWK